MDVSVKRALIAQCLNLNRLYIILLHHPLMCHISIYLQPVTAVFHCCTSMQLFRAVCIFLMFCIQHTQWRPCWAAFLPFHALSSQRTSECCHSALPLLLTVSEAPVLALGVASGSRLEDPTNRKEMKWPTTSRC